MRERKCPGTGGILPDPIPVHSVSLQSVYPFLLILSFGREALIQFCEWISASYKSKSKSSRPIRDESHSFVFPPNFIYLSLGIPLQVLTNPDSISGAPGKTYFSFQPAKLRNALQHLIHIRSHSPDSLYCHQYAYSFLHRFVVSTLPPFEMCVK